MRTSAACQEARDAGAAPLSDALSLARVTAHRSRCAGCRAYVERIQTTAEAVRAAAGPGLDDIARARVTARLALAIDELATHNSQRKRRAAGAPWFQVAAVAGLMAGAAALLILYGHGYRGPTQAARSRTAPSPAVVAAASAPAASPAAARVRGAAGPDADLTAELIKGRLEVPVGAVVRASVDRYTVLTVIGPAQLVVETVAPQISLRLESGLLVGEYEHHPGGTLRVHSPGATTTVVGTLFAVQAIGVGESRVAVRRGAVVVEGRGQAVQLRAGWSWSSGAVARSEIPAALEEPLAAHAAAGLAPSHGPALNGNRAHPTLRSRPVGQSVAALPERAARRSPEPSQALVQVGAVLPEYAASPASERSPGAQPRDPRAIDPAIDPAKDSAKDPAKDPAKDSAKDPAKDNTVAAAGGQRPRTEVSATADALYAEAEAAMRAGDRAAVRRHLTEVIRRFPRDGLADAALYELARREQADGQPAQARRYLDQLLGHDGAPELREPARYLRCRLELEVHHDAEALTCLGAFRRDFPSSPHDAEVLALLIGLYQVRDDCRRALPLLDEYTRRYPSGPLDARARRTRCEH